MTIHRAIHLNKLAYLILAICGVTPFLYGEQADSRLAPEDFAILPWGGTPGDAETLADIKACGFNLAGFVAANDVPAVAKAGLKCIVSGINASAGGDDVAIRKSVAAVTEKFKDNPAVYGYYLIDEPGAGVFSTLGKYAAAVRATAGSKQVPYLNLFPNYANAQQLGTATYAEYLQKFVDTVKPPFLSYDNYSLLDNGALRDGYFQNLESVRTAAIKNNLPFWNIVLSVAHFTYAEPNEDGFRFQAYTTLAYGARGISYFTYFSPGSGNYRLAPIDQFGHKTPTWDMLRRANLQIHKLGPTYVKLKSINVFHHPDVPSECQGIATARVVQSVSGGSLLVGEFEGPEKRPYAMVVNKDLHHSVPIGVTFKSPGTLMMVNQYNGELQNWGGEGIWLAAGQAALLTIQK